MGHCTVTVEHEETNLYLVWVHELPGCYAHGSTREEAVNNVEEAVERFRTWLRAKGEEVRDEPVEFDLVDAAAVPEMTPASGMLLTWDQAALTPGDWTRVEQWLHYSRLELLSALESMREEDNEHPNPWTARKAARRLVYHERWHLNSIRRLLHGLRGRDASGEGW